MGGERGEDVEGPRKWSALGLPVGLGEGEEKREGKGRAIKTPPLLNGLATGLFIIH